MSQSITYRILEKTSQRTSKTIPELVGTEDLPRQVASIFKNLHDSFKNPPIYLHYFRAQASYKVPVWPGVFIMNDVMPSSSPDQYYFTSSKPDFALEQLLAELAHVKQFQDQPVKNIFRLTKDLAYVLVGILGGTPFRSGFKNTYENKRPKGKLAQKRTIEHEAHGGCGNIIPYGDNQNPNIIYLYEHQSDCQTGDGLGPSIEYQLYNDIFSQIQALYHKLVKQNSPYRN